MSNFKHPAYALSTALLIGASSAAASAQETNLDIKFAGALEFAEDGTLFVGDNHNGSIYAFEIPAEESTHQTTPNSIANIDAKIAELLGVGTSAVEINDMAVHPRSHEIFISATRIGGFVCQPVIVKVSQDRTLSLVRLSDLSFQKVNLTEFPDSETKLAVRGAGPAPPLPRDISKGEVSLSSLAIMDMEFYQGELFVAGVAHENFLSSLRRIPFPFDGTQSIANVEMYHIAHDQYESRAPIRAMSVQTVDNKPQLIAAYTCSPIVLIPLEEITDGAKISARTIMDYGNGQPLDMIPFQVRDETMLFVTSNSRSPQVIPVKGLSSAQPVTHQDFERGPKLDMHPLMPYGPVGKTVMFEGVPLHMDLLDDNFFVSLTRDAYRGSLNLDINPTFFPNRIHNLVAEMDFPQFDRASATPKD